ncbi:hypothetical protein BY458DRAFT_547286 [Sporodiniella umbellata]|nr:hypothetical protein BY458DRAFT_547286 [Sporodiniella umbellata]
MGIDVRSVPPLFIFDTNPISCPANASDARKNSVRYKDHNGNSTKENISTFEENKIEHTKDICEFALPILSLIINLIATITLFIPTTTKKKTQIRTDYLPLVQEYENDNINRSRNER